MQIVKMQGKFLKSQAHVHANVCWLFARWASAFNGFQYLVAAATANGKTGISNIINNSNFKHYEAWLVFWNRKYKKKLNVELVLACTLVFNIPTKTLQTLHLTLIYWNSTNWNRGIFQTLNFTFNFKEDHTSLWNIVVDKK